MKKKRYFTNEEFAGLKKLIDNKAEIVVIATGGNAEDITHEIFSRFADVAPLRLSSSKLTLEEMQRITDAAKTLRHTRLFIMLLSPKTITQNKED